MRPFRLVRLLVVPALALPLVLSTIVLPGTAWAKGSKTVKCVHLNGTYGSSWSLTGCSPVTIAGSVGSGNRPQATVAQNFPTSPATITWGTPANRRALPLQTTIQFTVAELTGHKDKCGTGSREFLVSGSVTGNSESVGVRIGSKVKIFVCDKAGVLSSHKKSFKL
jgi:hypothetical protein